MGYSGMDAKDFEKRLTGRGIITASTFRRMIARSNPRGARTIEELWEIADLAGVPRSFMEDGFEPATRGELDELREAVSAVASAVSLEGLQEEQRRFLQGWLRRTPSPGSGSVRGDRTRGEG